MVLCSLGTTVYAAETGPRLSRVDLFAAIDLARPDLAAVSNAVARGDEAAATAAFARHLRTRAVPRWEVDPAATGRSPKASTTKARNALKHRLESIGIPWQFGESIDWAFNPTAQQDSKWPVNKEWTWQLNRHPMWLDLARAFHDTGDETYAAELAAQVRAWVRDCPVPVVKADNGAGSRWRTIEAGIRSGSVWPEIWPRVLASKAFDDDALLLLVASWVEHAQYLVKFKTGGNWLAMESNGLYHTGALFPEFREAKLWRATALERLTAELDIQVYPDGAQVELAPGYHGVSLRNFLGPVNLAARTGFDVPPAFLAKLERMFDTYVTSMQPTRRTPTLNDSGAGDVVGILREGARLFPNRADFRWIASGGKEGAPPAGLSRMLPFAGQVFLRSGWDPDALWLCMDAGPFGYGHQHEDKLGITLTAFGRPLLVEGGVYTYDASDWRRYVLSSRAHNVVMVDGLDQARRKAPRETWVVKQPVPLAFGTHATADWAEAVYDEGWGPDAKRIARHTRRVVFLKPDLFAVIDRLESLDGKPHRYEALFHLDAPDASIDGMTVTTRTEGPNLAIRAFGADGVSIVKGQKEPVVQGWLPDSSQGYGGIRPIPTAVFTKETPGAATAIYVLCPSRGPAACPVRRAAMDGETLVVEMENGDVRKMGPQRSRS
jgi:hypothetical protein